MQQVYVSRINNEKQSFLEQIKNNSRKVIEPVVSKGDMVGVKTHFGEEGNTAFVSPYYVRPIVDEILKKDAKPLLFDTNTLYGGKRENAYDHLNLALRHGFTLETVGAPIIIADGLKGKDYHRFQIDGKHFREVWLNSLLKQLDSVVVVSHVKGHSMAGFGGAIKNISMGFASRSGKQQMHSDVKPQVSSDVCTLCGICVEWCPVDAINLNVDGGSAEINSKDCIGCGECRVTCPEGAIDISWDTTPTLLQEKMAEYACGSMQVVKNKICFINFLINIVPDCDCWEWSGKPLIEDIGVSSSSDPVSLDKASCDLINERWQKEGKGKDVWRELYPRINWEVQLNHAEKMGVGSKKYKIVEL